jgi:hypothetical protein
MGIDKKFWDGKRWQGHAAFETVGHVHVSCFSPAPGHDSCDIMAVECADGRWYVEDHWGDDAKGAEGVWNPFCPSDAEPSFFDSEEAAIRHAVSVASSVSGAPQAELLKHFFKD